MPRRAEVAGSVSSRRDGTEMYILILRDDQEYIRYLHDVKRSNATGQEVQGAGFVDAADDSTSQKTSIKKHHRKRNVSSCGAYTDGQNLNRDVRVWNK